MKDKHNEPSQLLNQVKLSAVVKDIRSMDDDQLDKLGLGFSQLITDIFDDCASTVDGIKANVKRRTREVDVLALSLFPIDI